MLRVVSSVVSFSLGVMCALIACLNSGNGALFTALMVVCLAFGALFVTTAGSVNRDELGISNNRHVNGRKAVGAAA